MRRAVVLSVLLALVFAAFSAAPPASAVGPPLSAYTVYGENGVTIGVDSTIRGLVGARFNQPGSGGVALRMNGGAQIINDPSVPAIGDARIGANVRMDNNTLIQGTLYRTVGSTFQKAASATVGAEVLGDPELPTLPAPAPTPGGCPNNAPDDAGANNQTRTPAPSSINGDWVFGSNFTLNLNVPGATYTFNSLKAANGVTINAAPGVELFVCDNVTFGKTQVLPTTLTGPDFQVQILGTDIRNALRLGGGSHWIGDVYTPNGGIHIGSGGSTASFVGRFHAGGIVDIEHGVNGVGPGGGGGNQPVSNKDATLDHSAKNKNNGATWSLWVKSQVASVIGFDVTQVDLANVQSAKLRLTVCHTPGDLTFCPTPSNNWPAGGGLLHVQRLDDGWERWGSGHPNPTNTPAEGNGNNFPIDNNPRGTGAGATWNCAIDANIANEGRDCTSVDFWNAGLNFDGPERPSTTLLTNNMPDGTIVEFDVTADVQAGMGPLDTTYMTWFLRKVPNTGSGEAFFYSIQGAQQKGNPALAPQLIITP